MSAQAEALNKPDSLLKNKFFQTIILSNVILQVGIWIRNFSILMYVTDKTNNDPFAVGLMGFVEFLPIFVFSFIGGVFADRWRPRITMIWCDFLSAASVILVLVVLANGSWQMVYLVTFLSAILSQFSQPSAMKLFKQHIKSEQLQSSMAVFQSLVAIFMVVGPAMGIAAYHDLGIEVSLVITAVAFFISAAVLYRIPKDKAVETSSIEGSKIWTELSSGFKYVWRSPVLKSMGAVFALAGIAVGIVQTLSLFIVLERLGQPKEFLKYVLMVNGIAMLVGGGIVMSVAKKVAPQKLLAIGMLLSSIAIVVVGWSQNLTVTLVFQFISGLGFPCIQIGISTLILQWTEEKFVGRVNGVLTPMFMGMMVIMTLTAGTLKLHFPLVGIYTTAGILMLAGTLLLVPLFKYKAPLTSNSLQ